MTDIERMVQVIQTQEDLIQHLKKDMETIHNARLTIGAVYRRLDNNGGTEAMRIEVIMPSSKGLIIYVS